MKKMFAILGVFVLTILLLTGGAPVAFGSIQLGASLSHFTFEIPNLFGAWVALGDFLADMETVVTAVIGWALLAIPLIETAISGSFILITVVGVGAMYLAMSFLGRVISIAKSFLG